MLSKDLLSNQYRYCFSTSAESYSPRLTSDHANISAISESSVGLAGQRAPMAAVRKFANAVWIGVEYLIFGLEFDETTERIAGKLAKQATLRAFEHRIGHRLLSPLAYSTSASAPAARGADSRVKTHEADVITLGERRDDGESRTPDLPPRLRVGPVCARRRTERLAAATNCARPSPARPCCKNR